VSATAASLFQPVDFGTIRVSNRLALVATGLGAYGEDVGRYRENIAGYVEARARGGVGMMLLPAMGLARLDRFPPGEDGQAWFASHVEPMAGFAALAHRHGVPIGIQLLHRGAQAPQRAGQWAPSDVSWSPRQPRPTPLTDGEAVALVDRHARSARLAVDAGFDFVEVHIGHGYLVHEFLSPRFNHRQDGPYAGAEGGVRYATEVLAAVRAAVGPVFPLSMRVSAAERAESGLALEQMLATIPRLARYVNLVNVSAGAYGSDPVIVAPHSVPYGFNAELARAVRAVVRLPVLSAGRIWDPAQMAALVESGACDIIGLGRALWADPDLPNKIKSGAAGDIRPAIGCNQGCIDRTDGGVRTCLVNPFWGREREWVGRPAGHPRRVCVAGGGPAGLEVARIAAERGHEVTLLEEATALGGRFRLAARAPGKEEFGQFTGWQVRRAIAAGVAVELGTRCDRQALGQLRPDVLVMATGAAATVAAAGLASALTPEAALDKPWLAGARIEVRGADQAHLEAALFLAAQGRQVVVIAAERPAAGMGPTARYHLMRKLSSAGVIMHRRDRPANGAGDPLHGSFDSVVCGRLTASRELLEESLAGLDAEIHWVGDAAQVGDALTAVADAAELALRL
jgi:2,4-dienoyl-CoA reductase-like NADH-dependent reductase (Old Yellow Enzyme family)